jgi:hypothetical protein
MDFFFLEKKKSANQKTYSKIKGTIHPTPYTLFYYYFFYLLFFYKTIYGKEKVGV